MRTSSVAIVGILVAYAIAGCASETTPRISIVTEDVVPVPLYEDDPSFSFRIYFEGQVVPAAGNISVLVDDRYGQVYRQLDRVVRPEADGALVSVSVPMLFDTADRDSPSLPSPGPIRIRIWDGASYETSALRDETTVELTARGVVESGGLAGGGPLTRGERTIIWGVNPRIDPSDPGLVYQGNVDVWTLTGARAGGDVLVEYGAFDTAPNTQFASVYLRELATGEIVARDVTRIAGAPTTIAIPGDGDYELYVVHDPTQWADTAEYRLTWR